MTTQTAQPAAPAARRLSLIMIAFICVALLAGASWWFAPQIGRPPDNQLFEVMPPAALAYQVSQAVAANAANNPNLKQVRGGDFMLVANRNNNQWTLHLNYTKGDLIPPQQVAALIAASRLSIDAAFAKSLGVNEDQVAQLKKIPAGVRLIVAEADRPKIHKAWDAYLASQTPATQSDLEKTVQEVGQNSLDPTRKTLGDRAEKVAAILTEQQIAPFKP
jgi:hypothetical protein